MTETNETAHVAVDRPPERSQRTIESDVHWELLAAGAVDAADSDVDFDQRLPQVPGPEARSE